MASAVDVVVVSYNTRDYLRRCLAALGGEDARVVVVDNGSTDGSQAMVAAEFPAVSLLRSAANGGYAAALNQGLRRGRAEMVLLLNGDAWLMPGALETLRRLMEGDGGLALLGPRVVAPDGRAEGSCGRLPGVWRGLAGALGRKAAGVYGSPAAGAGVQAVEWVSGVCCLARRAALEALCPRPGAGPLDEGYVMYFEDMDLCWRLGRAGWRVGATSEAGVVHAGSASWQGARGRGRKRWARDASQIRYFSARGQHGAAAVARARRVLRAGLTRYYAADG